jgi:hypothetical protein
MTYSDVVSTFYKITLREAELSLIDTHFDAAAHHLLRAEEAADYIVRLFHLTWHRAHMRAISRIVHSRGNFGRAVDPSQMGLEERDAWNPDRNLGTNKELFIKMRPDPFFGLGKAHPSDIYINPDQRSSVRLVS